MGRTSLIPTPRLLAKFHLGRSKATSVIPPQAASGRVTSRGGNHEVEGTSQPPLRFPTVTTIHVAMERSCPWCGGYSQDGSLCSRKCRQEFKLMDAAGYQRYCERVAKARKWERMGVLFGAMLVGGWFLISITPSSSEPDTGTPPARPAVSTSQQVNPALYNADGGRPTPEPNAVLPASSNAPNTTTPPVVDNPLPGSPVVSGPDPFLAIPSDSDAGFHTWTRASDGNVVQAKVLAVESGVVTFQLRNGTTFRLPFNLLTKEDQVNAVREAQKRKHGE